MNVNFEKSTFEINFYDLFTKLDNETKNKLLEHFSCDSYIYNYVAQQILDKWTDNGYSGTSFISPSPDPQQHGLDWAWREVAKRSGDVAKREITRLEDELKRVKKELQDLQMEIYQKSRLNNKYW